MEGGGQRACEELDAEVKERRLVRPVSVASDVGDLGSNEEGEREEEGRENKYI